VPIQFGIQIKCIHDIFQYEVREYIPKVIDISIAHTIDLTDRNVTSYGGPSYRPVLFST